MILPKKISKNPINLSKTADNLQEKEKGCNIKVYLISFLINLLLVFFVLIEKNIIPPEVPLLYGLPEGKSQLAKKPLLISPAIIAIIFTFTNFVICKKNKNNFVKKLSTYSLVPINFFSSMSIIRIITLVGNL